MAAAGRWRQVYCTLSGTGLDGTGTGVGWSGLVLVGAVHTRVSSTSSTQFVRAYECDVSVGECQCQMPASVVGCCAHTSTVRCWQVDPSLAAGGRQRRRSDRRWGGGGMQGVPRTTGDAVSGRVSE